jgi:hypothetical protein
MRLRVPISLFVLVFAASLFACPAGANAGSKNESRKSLASILRIKAVSLVLNNSTVEKKAEDETSKIFSVPLDRGFKAFADFTSPIIYRGLRPEDGGSDHRAVFGFSLPLK